MSVDSPTHLQDRQFSFHPDMIFSIIHAQAGTPAKAFLELVMNSIDAGASRVTIDIDTQRFVVADDGRGFASRKEIGDWFECFGTPHRDGDARFGTYRMGRGQIFSFAANRWETGVYTMDVDVKHRGLRYTLTEASQLAFAGCRITGSFYDRLSPSDLHVLLRDLEQMVAYAEVPVVVNGKQVNKLPADCSWDVETEDAYIYAGDVGCGGVVVSKKQLKVNFARNDVLISRCEVWKRMRKFLTAQGTERTLRSARLDDAGRAHLIRQLLDGSCDLKSVWKAKFLVLANRRRVDLETLVYNPLPVCVCDDPGSRVADVLIGQRIAFVLSRQSLDEFGVDNLEDLRRTLRAVAGRDSGHLRESLQSGMDRMQVREFSTLAESIVDGHRLLAPADLTKLEQVKLLAVKHGHGAISRWFWYNTGPDEVGGGVKIKPRRIVVGESETADAWTDGQTFIAINRTVLRRAQEGVSGFQWIAALIVHEYLHDCADSGSHMHDHEFYERFHEVILAEGNPVGYAGRRMYRKYLEELQRRGMKVAVTVLRDADLEHAHEQLAEPPMGADTEGLLMAHVAK